MDVSVIVVNYKTRDLTLQCLRSLFKYTYGVKMEVIVVDNASQDDTPYSIRREFPQVRVVESQENLGFGKANNLGNTYAIGKYLFLLNSDTIVIHNIVRQFFEFMEIHPEYVSCGGNLLDRDGVNCNVGGNFPSVMQEFLSIGFHRLVPRWFKNRYTLSKSVADSGMLICLLVKRYLIAFRVSTLPFLCTTKKQIFIIGCIWKDCVRVYCPMRL